MNTTDCDTMSSFASESSKFATLATLSLLAIFTIVGNIVIITIVIYYHYNSKNIFIYITSMAFADLCVGVAVMPWYMYYMATGFIPAEGHQRNTLCLTARSFDVLFTTTSMVHLFGMTIDRYIAICWPLKHKTMMSKCFTKFVVALCWITPAIISFPVMFSDLPDVDKDGLPGEMNAESCSPKCMFRMHFLFALIGSSLAFFIPSLVMVVVTVKILITIRRRTIHLHNLSEICVSEVQQRHRLQTEIRVTKTTVILLACFEVCWLPFFVYSVVDPFIEYSTPELIVVIVTWLGYTNSGINPVLYYFIFIYRGFSTKPDKTISCYVTGKIYKQQYSLKAS